MELLIIKQNEWLQLNETIQHNQAMQEINHPNKPITLQQTPTEQKTKHIQINSTQTHPKLN